MSSLHVIRWLAAGLVITLLVACGNGRPTPGEDDDPNAATTFAKSYGGDLDDVPSRGGRDLRWRLRVRRTVRGKPYCSDSGKSGLPTALAGSIGREWQRTVAELHRRRCVGRGAGSASRATWSRRQPPPASFASPAPCKALPAISPTCSWLVWTHRAILSGSIASTVVDGMATRSSRRVTAVRSHTIGPPPSNPARTVPALLPVTVSLICAIALASAYGAQTEL